MLTATVIQLPGAGAAHPEPQGLLLSPAEVTDAAGGYRRAADQLRELQRRGFTRAYIPAVGRKRVVLERAHYDAVVRGQYGQAEAGQRDQRPAPRANRAGLARLFAGKRTK